MLRMIKIVCTDISTNVNTNTACIELWLFEPLSTLDRLQVDEFHVSIQYVLEPVCTYLSFVFDKSHKALDDECKPIYV